MAVSVNYDGQILLSTLWNQQDIIKCGDNSTINFNEYAPLDPLVGRRSDTGCSNTAMGQIIYYFLEQDLLDFKLSLTDRDIFVSFGNVPTRAITFTPEGDENTGLYSFAEINEMLSVFVPAPTDVTASDYSVKSETAAKFIAALNLACGVINKATFFALTGTRAEPDISAFTRSGFKSAMTTETFSPDEKKRFFTTRKHSTKDEEVTGLTAATIENILSLTIDASGTAAGCFDDAASEKIFEDKNKGMLA